MAKRKIVFIFSCLFFLTSPSISLASSESAKLKSVTAQLNSLVNQFHVSEKSHDKLESQLKHIEINIGNEQKLYNETKTKVDGAQHRLSMLKRKQTKSENLLHKQQQALSDQLRTSYILGQQSYAKTLLSQQNPQTFSRMMTYFNYVNNERLTLIHKLNNTLADIEQNERLISIEADTLEKLQNKEQKQIARLQKEKTLQQDVLNSLEKTMQTQQQKIKTLKTTRSNLENILKGMNQPYYSPHKQSKSFRKLRGHLPWPTDGAISLHYGAPILQTNMRATGTVITGKSGEQVYAIYPGKVIFADWLKGFGLLIIIDHGHGYMSLYARNESLYKQVGQTVQGGDLIAKMGHSGGYKKSGLYFEIRYKGSPLNPERWCSNTAKPYRA